VQFAKTQKLVVYGGLMSNRLNSLLHRVFLNGKKVFYRIIISRLSKIYSENVDFIKKGFSFKRFCDIIYCTSVCCLLIFLAILW